MGKVSDVDEGGGKGDDSLASVIRVNKWINKMLKATELGDSFRARSKEEHKKMWGKGPATPLLGQKHQCSAGIDDVKCDKWTNGVH